MYSTEEQQCLSYDAFRQSCVSHTILETLSSKWVYLIVSALRAGPVRNGALQRKVQGITPKMLAQTLRSLERDGLVSRTIFPVVPPHVEYALTPLGHNLSALLSQIREWAELHVPDIIKARHEIDNARLQEQNASPFAEISD